MPLSLMDLMDIASISTKLYETIIRKREASFAINDPMAQMHSYYSDKVFDPAGTTTCQQNSI